MADKVTQGGGETGPVSPHDRRMYEEEYKRGAKLFQNALDSYVKSDNKFQQEEFHQVMEKAMRVLNETAQGLNRKALLDQNKKIEKDYANFNDNPKDENYYKTLEHDLEQARQSIG